MCFSFRFWFYVWVCSMNTYPSWTGPIGCAAVLDSSLINALVIDSVAPKPPSCYNLVIWLKIYKEKNVKQKGSLSLSSNSKNYTWTLLSQQGKKSIRRNSDQVSGLFSIIFRQTHTLQRKSKIWNYCVKQSDFNAEIFISSSVQNFMNELRNVCKYWKSKSKPQQKWYSYQILDIFRSMTSSIDDYDYDKWGEI